MGLAQAFRTMISERAAAVAFLTKPGVALYILPAMQTRLLVCSHFVLLLVKLHALWFAPHSPQ